MKKNNILLIGFLGYETNQLDGQTVKSIAFYEMLRHHSDEINELCYFDTQRVRYKKTYLFTLFKYLCKSKILVYIPAHKSLKYLFPLLFVFSKLMKISIIHIVVGGWLSDYLERKPLHRVMLKNIEHIFSQVTATKTELCAKYGFKNIDVIPNFRYHNFTPQLKISPNDSILKIVFMARINKMKGYESVFNLAKYIKENDLNILIDFYGQINDLDREDFLSCISLYNFVSYRGYLQPESIYDAISQYDLMLFPTKYYTEGFPGTILDAYIAGVPVLVTNWAHAAEFVRDGVSGYIMPFENCEEYLIEKIIDLYENRTKVYVLKKNAFEESKKYSVEVVWNILKHYMV
jgi:glycosyltransferase involved in cell wall biosynthesis